MKALSHRMENIVEIADEPGNPNGPAVSEYNRDLAAAAFYATDIRKKRRNGPKRCP